MIVGVSSTELPLSECNSVVTAVAAVVVMPFQGHAGHSRFWVQWTVPA